MVDVTKHTSKQVLSAQEDDGCKGLSTHVQWAPPSQSKEAESYQAL